MKATYSNRPSKAQILLCILGLAQEHARESAHRFFQALKTKENRQNLAMNIVGIRPDRGWFGNTTSVAWRSFVVVLGASAISGFANDITHPVNIVVRNFKDNSYTIVDQANSIIEDDKFLKTANLPSWQKAEIMESRKELRAKLALMQKELDQPAP